MDLSILIAKAEDERAEVTFLRSHRLISGGTGILIQGGLTLKFTGLSSLILMIISTNYVP